MFDMFKKKTAKDFMDEARETYLQPAPEEKTPEEKKKPSTTYYRLGLTDDDRVSLSMGYSEITMNRAGIDSMIAALSAFKDLIPEDKDEQPED